MSKEQEIQGELEKYWGQLDRVEKMLKWLVVESLIGDEEVDPNVRARVALNQPDIGDILEGK